MSSLILASFSFCEHPCGVCAMISSCSCLLHRQAILLRTGKYRQGDEDPAAHASIGYVVARLLSSRGPALGRPFGSIFVAAACCAAGGRQRQKFESTLPRGAKGQIRSHGKSPTLSGSAPGFCRRPCGCFRCLRRLQTEFQGHRTWGGGGRVQFHTHGLRGPQQALVLE